MTRVCAHTPTHTIRHELREPQPPTYNPSRASARYARHYLPPYTSPPPTFFPIHTHHQHHHAMGVRSADAEEVEQAAALRHLGVCKVGGRRDPMI